MTTITHANEKSKDKMENEKQIEETDMRVSPEESNKSVSLA